MFKNQSTWPPTPVFSELTPEGQKIYAAQWLKVRRAAECGHSACRDDDSVWQGCHIREEE